MLRGTSRAVARRRAALSPSWDPGAGLCQVSRRDSRRAGPCAARPVAGAAAACQEGAERGVMGPPLAPEGTPRDKTA